MVQSKNHRKLYNIRIGVLRIENSIDECNFYRLHDGIHTYNRCCFSKKAAAKYDNKMLVHDSFDAMVKVGKTTSSNRLYIRIVKIVGDVQHNVINRKRLMKIDDEEIANFYSSTPAPTASAIASPSNAPTT